MDKNILIVLQTHNNIVKNFKYNLEKNSFAPYFYPSSQLPKYQPNIVDKIINFALKKIYSNFSFFDYRKQKREQKYNFQQKNNLENYSENFFDYCIVFRADSLEDQLLSKLRSKSKKLIGYQWDGMNRYPNVFSKLSFFDRFFCFDPNDSNEQINFITNFYFDKLPSALSSEILWDITYIGHYTDERFDLLEKIAKSLPHLKLNFKLNTSNYKNILKIKASKYVKYLDDVYDYSTLLEIHNQSKAILDIKADEHSGLSFRIFEAMQFDKKLITTNSEIINYDLYNESNILILNTHNCNEIERFINNPYQSILPAIKEKYSFTNWLNNIISFEK